MRRYLALILLLVATVAFAAGDSETHNTVPSAGLSFLSNLTTFLKDEDANRFTDMFHGFVVEGGTHATQAGVTATPDPLKAYPGGWYITENAAITYPTSSTCWVIATRDKTGNIDTFARVAGTHYAIDCFSAVQPTIPTNSVYLMKVVTSPASISNVVDLRSRAPFDISTPGPTSIFGTGQVGDMLYYDTTSTISKLNDVGTGNALISGGINTAFSWGKIGLTTHVSGTLPVGNGGTGTTAIPSNGQIPIGDGAKYVPATLTAGTGISITNAAGSVTIAQTAAPSNAKSGTLITISNSAAETTIFTTTLAANKMGTSNRFRFNLQGVVNNTAGLGTRTYTIRVKYGGSTIVTCVASVGGSLTNVGSALEGAMSEVTDATNAQFTTVAFTWDDKIQTCSSGTTNSAIDSTVNQTFAITMQLQTANASLIYYMKHAMTEIIQ